MKIFFFLLSKFKILLLFLSIFLVLLPTVRAAEDANQVQASSLLQIPISKSLSLTNMILDGENTVATLELERFEVFSPDAQIIIHDAQGKQTTQSPPVAAYFKGHIAGDLNSLVVLSADSSGTMRGIAQKEKKLWILAGGIAVDAPSLGLVSQEVAQSGQMSRSAPFQCGVEGNNIQTLTAPPLPATNNLPVEPLPSGQFYQVKVAIETDGEFYNLLGSANAATSYIGDLFAYSSAVYQRETEARLLVGYVSLWSGGPTSDPWDHTSTLSGLFSFRDYWNANRGSVSRTIAHFLSGRSLGGGVAYLEALCNKSYGYGYSADLDGLFQIGNPQPVWDIIVVAHEIGHNFSSPHTHCYGGIGGNSNPVDACYNQEQGAGCWAGGTALPGTNALTGGTAGGGNGTIMSYCHLLYPSYYNISLTFGKTHNFGIQANRVSTKMASYVANTASSYPSCITIGGAQTYTVGLIKAGTGSGTISGGGNYAAGATVNLTATPATGSTFAGWSPSPCAASFTMPANNLTCTATFNLVSSKPDLIVTSVTSPSSGVIGEQIGGFSMTVKNQGTADAGAFLAEIYLSADTTVTTSDIYTGWSCSFSSLAAGASATCGGNVGIPASVAPGKYYLGIYADSDNKASESNESNNGRAASNQITLTRNSAPLPVYRFYNTTAGGHFFTMNEEEKNTVIDRYKWFRYEGVGFNAYSFQIVGNILPVYRFYNTTAGGHFFTLNEEEKNTVINHYKWFRYEGVGFYAFPFQAVGTLPVYRFYNMTAGGHFFTMNEAERDIVINHYKWFRYEGVGFYAWPAL